MNKEEEFPNPKTPSTKPEKAYKNLSFLNSPAARPIRVLCELAEPGMRLDAADVRNTIVFFGSARNPAPEQAEKLLEETQSRDSGPALSEEAQQQVEARRRQIQRAAKYYRIALDLSRKLTEWSLQQEDADKQFYICSGGGPGIMEAANRGAKEAGGKSIGLGISLPFEQGINAYCDPELSFDFHYFFLRKYWFLFHAKALVVFPGGFGTFDELFEMLTLIQTQKTKKHIRILLMGREFWENTINFSNLVEWGTISPEDVRLFQIIDDVEEAYDLLIEPFASGQVTPGGDPHMMPE
ncbi:LOG family protein [Puniceicoccus vermicola]|uniref:AMP nucleosidase n=1 Tax=Puniceicoccus vermicola TaxID=388746 RepID=A0A7X1AUR8_9BACT|nr:LOG family protein [Puniceicoccus vermicola]MBC2600376.1 LOG family protein [Puniceicoccus vermicola]